MKGLFQFRIRNALSRLNEQRGYTYTEDQAADLFDGFIKLLNNDQNFKQYKMEQLKKSPETLSAIEMFAFQLISSTKSQKEQIHEEVTDELEYET